MVTSRFTSHLRSFRIHRPCTPPAAVKFADRSPHTPGYLERRHPRVGLRVPGTGRSPLARHVSFFSRVRGATTRFPLSTRPPLRRLPPSRPPPPASGVGFDPRLRLTRFLRQFSDHSCTRLSEGALRPHRTGRFLRSLYRPENLKHSFFSAALYHHSCATSRNFLFAYAFKLKYLRSTPFLAN